MSAEFDIESLTKDENDDIRGLKPHISNAMVVDSEGFTAGAEVEDEEMGEESDGEETMATDDSASTVTSKQLWINVGYTKQHTGLPFYIKPVY
ncbi:hypothetical protein EB796_021094 [Bugula neritina]|uniref:Uncharacterized protein n=1 Tax=Bugula neritina TaxID=10212 RepID=A0A7J7J2Z3_BUGNE|nr:hypothetical protein EB796_021094 [Bugula neritina]